MKKIKVFALIMILVLSLGSLGFAQSKGKVYVVPIRGEINRATYNYLRDVMNKLNNEKVEGIIFEIDTYGGLIDEAQKIKNLIMSTNIPTISFVNDKAESAGVLITIASQKIVMAPNSSIGSAETIPNTEKVLSLWRSFLRDTAISRGRNHLIIEAMADRDISIPGISPKGKLVNLTSGEALEYGIADLVSRDYSEILAYFDMANLEVEVLNEGLQIKLAKYVSKPFVSSLLLSIGFIGLVVELLTPGFGIGGTISIIGFGLFFGGNILSGNSNWTALALFVVGLILLVIEGMVPGFGLPGISGIIFVVGGTILAMDTFTTAILSLSIAIIITTIVTIILMKLGFKSKMLDKIILNTQHDTEKGYVSGDSKEDYLDKEGKTLSELRPSGYVDIDGERIDALSEGGYIPKNTLVKVIRVEGSKIFVRRM